MILGYVAASGYTMKGQTDRATETTSNNGIGNPVIYTGMVRTIHKNLFLLDNSSAIDVAGTGELCAPESCFKALALGLKKQC